MTHYFLNDEKLKSDKKLIEVFITKIKFKFYTDNGVFSKTGLDFGTRALLESLPVSVINGKILDFGCGYGPIGIYLSKTLNTNIDMVDINERSINLALENAKLNNVNVNVFKSDIYSNIDQKYDHIVTNPPIRVGKEILYKILFDAYDHLTENGTVWLVINKNQGAKSLLKDLSEKYKTEVIAKVSGFYIIKASK